MHFRSFAFLIGLVLIPSAAHSAVIVIESTFDSDSDGWVKAPGSDGNSSVGWSAAGGNPGGYLLYSEGAQGGIDRIAAPAAFLGDRADFIGGTLSMDRLILSSSSPFYNDDITLIGGSFTLRFDLAVPPLNVWTTGSVELTYDAGWVHVGSGLTPTPSEFSEVMSNLTGLYLLAEYRNGPETPGFDNIRMISPELGTSAIPEPSGPLALGVLLGSVLFFRTRRA